MSPELICLTPQHTAYLEQIAKLSAVRFRNRYLRRSCGAVHNRLDYRIDAWIAVDIVLSYVVMQIVAQEVQILSVASVEKNKGYASALLIRCIQNLHKNELANCIYLEVRCPIQLQNMYTTNSDLFVTVYVKTYMIFLKKTDILCIWK